MSLIQWIVSAPTQQQINAWAMEVARNCREGVAARLGLAMQQMSLAEARGYIQSRANLVLDEQIGHLQQTAGGEASVISVIRQSALEEILRLALGDFLKAARQPAPRRQAA